MRMLSRSQQRELFDVEWLPDCAALQGPVGFEKPKQCHALYKVKHLPGQQQPQAGASSVQAPSTSS